MKKIICVLFTIVLTFVMSFSSIGIAYAANTLKLEKSPMYVTIGGSITQHLLTSSGKVVNGKKVTWTANNPERVKISKSGKVTGLTKGSTTIKAKYKGKTYKFKAYVKYAKKEFSEASLTVGESITQVIYAASGNKASISKVEFTSADSDIATVDENGKITAVSEGTVKIYAKYFGKKYIAKITVIPGEKNKEEKTSEDNKTDSQISIGGIGGGTVNVNPVQDDEDFEEETSETEPAPQKSEEPIRNLLNTTYEEYKKIISGGMLNSFRSEFIGLHGGKKYIDWLSKMKEIEKQEEQKEYVESIEFK